MSWFSRPKKFKISKPNCDFSKYAAMCNFANFELQSIFSAEIRGEEEEFYLSEFKQSSCMNRMWCVGRFDNIWTI